MQLDSEAILAAALGLSAAERLQLISRLMETIPEADLTLSLDDPGLVEELDRRFADRQGEVAWSEIKAEG